MRRHLRAHRSRTGPKGAALAIAVLVVAMLSVIGIVALNAATFDVASAGSLRRGVHAATISETGLDVGRCQMCKSLDGVTAAMKAVREDEGRSAEFVLRDDELVTTLDPATAFYAPPAAGERGTFGYVGATPPTADFFLRVDRPREAGGVAGYSMRESTGSDAGTLCFRRYRLSSTGTFVPPGSTGVLAESHAEHRAFVVAGPVDCAL